MTERFEINAKHGKIRPVLRILGPALLGIGLICFIVALIDFIGVFRSFGEMPTKFWLFFAAFPLIFAGLSLTGFGFMGALARFQAQEIAPVGKDTFNYLAKETKEGVRDIAEAIHDGISTSAGDAVEPNVRCRKCNAIQDSDAKFCDECGAALTTSKSCPQCDEMNDPDARLCGNCAHQFS